MLVVRYIPRGRDLFQFNGKLHTSDYVVKSHLYFKKIRKKTDKRLHHDSFCC